MAIDPCHACTNAKCVLGSRKHDCLAAFEGLRAISNNTKIGGFKEAPYWLIQLLSPAEKQYYSRMTGIPLDVLDIL